MPELRQLLWARDEAVVRPSSALHTHLSPHPPYTTLASTHRESTDTPREWFTFCFVPIIPFSLKPYKEVGCHICNFWQDIKYRPDVQQQMQGAGGGQPAVMMGGNGQGAPPSGVPQYK
jgi:hypothetical protein